MNFRKKIWFVTLTILGCAAALVFVMINNLSLAQAKESIPIFHIAQARQTETLRKFPFPHLIINGQVEPTGKNPSVSTQGIGDARFFVSTFETTIVKRPFNIKVYDTGEQDGDVVRILLNGTFVKQTTLTSAGEVIELKNVRARVNRIEFVAVSEGSIPPFTLGISYAADQVVENQTYAKDDINLTVGQTYSTTVGFPQIALCLAVKRFPCTGPGPHPESAQHVLDAFEIPPQPITAPLRPRRVGNPVPRSYPRLLTLDRPNAIARRRRSVAPYQCPAGANLDRDEYPPAVVEENGGSAHIKCIDGDDNSGAGRSFANQINFYRIREGEPAQPRLDDKDTIEFVVLF